MKLLTPLTISFEFFPPKTVEGNDHLHDAAFALAACKPNFFSVTYGAGGSTRVGTVETIKMLQAKTKLPTAPHLSCIGSEREEICSMLATYKLLGVKRIVALRGDLPSGMGQAAGFKYASELVALIRQVTGDYFHIEVAAYPEIHPQAQGVHDDVLNLKRKYEAGANSAITQYFYNPDAYFYYLDDCAKHGISMPLVPGIMPVTQFHKLIRFSEVCGAEIPRWMRKRLESYGDDTVSIKKFGVEVVYHLCERLLVGGAPGLHFYTLNRAESCLEILNHLNLIPQHANTNQTYSM